MKKISRKATVDITPSWAALFKLAEELVQKQFKPGDGGEIVAEMLQTGKRFSDLAVGLADTMNAASSRLHSITRNPKNLKNHTEFFAYHNDLIDKIHELIAEAQSTPVDNTLCDDTKFVEACSCPECKSHFKAVGDRIWIKQHQVNLQGKGGE